jgi:hypothetical protein
MCQVAYIEAREGDKKRRWLIGGPPRFEAKNIDVCGDSDGLDVRARNCSSARKLRTHGSRSASTDTGMRLVPKYSVS